MKKEVWNLVNDVQMALPPLTQAAAVIDLLIDNYSLDRTDLNNDEMYDIGLHHDQIYNALQLVKSTLYSTAEEIERITENAGKEEGAA